jgi:DUF971 family protein/molybdopterin converting factor small subunit
MTQNTPTHIAIHQKSRVLEIHFADASEHHLPFEYLRVFSPSAEVKAAKNRGEIIKGKQDVVITGAEPVGSYALRLIFDDGHDTGVYSWDTLHKLAQNHASNWADYQRELAQADTSDTAGQTITVLFFMTLAELFGRESLNLDLSPDMQKISDLLEHLRQQHPLLAPALQPDMLTITVNKQFASEKHALLTGDEVALVPRAATKIGA